jgi:hypothetical protein
MKKFLLASAAGALLILPGISGASTLDFETNGSQNTLLFDPSGCNPSNLPQTGFYRSYDCRIGGKVTFPTITFTPPPPPPSNNNVPNNNNNNNKNNGNNNNNNGGNNNPPPNNNPPGNNQPQGNFPPPDNNPPGNPPPNDGTTVPPCHPDPCGPHGGCDPAAVPVPNSAAMAGVGVGALSIFSWLRKRRQSRA